MLSRTELEQFAKICTSIGNEVADETGFVPIRNLLKRFQASLVIRPLLVEGMLASIDNSNIDSSSASNWMVLVDSETYNIPESAIAKENILKPLPSRFRNTIAHELVHSLAFRPAEYGIQLRNQLNKKITNAEQIKYIEEQTEQFSPLLLLPQNSLKTILSTKECLSIDDVTCVCKSMGISRQVFVNRLLLLAPSDNLRNHATLRNIGIGIGQWRTENQFALRSWPLFLNFNRNIVPNFLLKLSKQDYLSNSEIFPENTLPKTSCLEFEVNGGTMLLPHKETMRIQFSFEYTSIKKGSIFLFVVNNLT